METLFIAKIFCAPLGSDGQSNFIDTLRERLFFRKDFVLYLITLAGIVGFVLGTTRLKNVKQ